MKPKRIAVAVSGSGRTLENLIRHQENYVVAAVIVSNQKCRGYTIAENAKLPVFHDSFSSQVFVKDKIFDWLEKHDIDFVALGGFLKKFPVVPSWQGRIFNIHPALLPKFGGHNMYGHKVHEAVIAAEEDISGATVHVVNEIYDDGPIVSQGSVTIEKNDTPESLADKVFKVECFLYPKTLNEIAKRGGFHSDQKLMRLEDLDNKSTHRR